MNKPLKFSCPRLLGLVWTLWLSVRDSAVPSDFYIDPTIKYIIRTFIFCCRRDVGTVFVRFTITKEANVRNEFRIQRKTYMSYGQWNHTIMPHFYCIGRIFIKEHTCTWKTVKFDICSSNNIVAAIIPKILVVASARICVNTTFKLAMVALRKYLNRTDICP